MARGRETRHHVRREDVSETLQSPKYRHWQQVKRTVRYFAGTCDYVQQIEVNNKVIGDFAGDVEWSGTKPELKKSSRVHDESPVLCWHAPRATNPKTGGHHPEHWTGRRTF